MKLERITSLQVQREFGKARRAALQAPVAITHRGKEDLVLLSAEAYRALASYAPTALYAHELPDDIAAALETPLESIGAERFDEEVSEDYRR